MTAANASRLKSAEFGDHLLGLRMVQLAKDFDSVEPVAARLLGAPPVTLGAPKRGHCPRPAIQVSGLTEQLRRVHCLLDRLLDLAQREVCGAQPEQSVSLGDKIRCLFRSGDRQPVMAYRVAEFAALSTYHADAAERYPLTVAVADLTEEAQRIAQRPDRLVAMAVLESRSRG